MGTASLSELLQKWKVEDLTIEQAIGQMLQHLVIIRNQLNDEQVARPNLKAQLDIVLAELQDVKARQAQLQADVNKLLQQANLKPTKIKRKSSRKRKP